MRVDDFDYQLPPELIAQEPAPRRDASRLMVVGPEGIAHRSFAELPDLLPRDALLVVNDTRVIRARIFARKPSGGRIEVLFLEPCADGMWKCLVRPAKALRRGLTLTVDPPRGRPTPDAEPPTLRIADEAQGGIVRVAVQVPSVVAMLEDWGETPLPPYISRPCGAGSSDDARYQTVFAAVPGAAASPTAGLHFTPELLQALEDRGIRRATLTLHVGLGTFAPVRVDDPREHRMHVERYEVPPETAAAHAEARANRRAVVAVGTTVVRTLESAWDGHRLRSGPGETGLFILPGHRFGAVDLLVTNFHVPRSTLLMLVCAFAGRERIVGAYEQAVTERYRFFSFGDAMLLYPETQ